MPNHTPIEMLPELEQLETEKYIRNVHYPPNEAGMVTTSLTEEHFYTNNNDRRHIHGHEHGHIQENGTVSSSQLQENHTKYPHELIQQTEHCNCTLNCVDVANHVSSCPVCCKLYNNNERIVYIITIIILVIICLLLFKKVVHI